MGHQHQNMANKAAKIEECTSELTKLWDNFTSLLACRAKAQEEYGQYARANVHEQRQYQIHQQTLLAAETSVAQAEKKLNTAKIEHQSLLVAAAQL